ncbi:MAG: leucyl/phenylalanyl-tRNA--protein transferase [Gammaproteobacteria bacterium]|nr:leucyl/phenylalanyl-tRNA--protein transferase [Gammaproteobacteria bacterium]
MKLTWLRADTPFPDPGEALAKPNGLLAAGGDLSPQRLLDAYSRGIFPWFEEDQPILWWSPDPRAVLFVDDFKPSRSLAKTLRRGHFQCTIDQDFSAVTAACAGPRADQDGTWITEDMRAAYGELHRLGHAHSVETWQNGRLVGGLYGVCLGRMFFGESMFSRVSDASKAALCYLVEFLRPHGYPLIDCQVANPHTLSLGAIEIPRERYLKLVAQYATLKSTAPWPGALSGGNAIAQ